MKQDNSHISHKSEGARVNVHMSTLSCLLPESVNNSINEE